MANEVKVKIIYTDEESAKKLVESAKDNGGEAGKGFGGNFANAVSTAVGIGIFKAVSGAVSGVKNQLLGTIQAAQKLEVIETQFKTILGSTKAAQKQLADLQDFAASTPFQIEGLSTATRQLLSFGVAQENVIPTLTKIGDIAAGVGADIDELTIPYGRLVSTQKLTLVELDKFADRGVNLYKKLADQTGVSLKDIRDNISKGKVPFKEFEDAIGSLTSEGGMFFGGMAAQSKTLSGVISTLKDNFFNLQANIGAAFKPFIIAIVAKLTGGIKTLSKAVTNFVSNASNIQNIVSELFKFGDTLINFVIKPMELLGNVGSLVFSGVMTGVAALTAGVGKLGGMLSFVLDKLGIMKDFSQGLKDFSDTSAQVLEENALRTREALAGITDTSFSEGLMVRNEEFRSFLTQIITDTDEAKTVLGEKNKEVVAAVAEVNTSLAKSIGEVWDGLSFKMVESSKIAADTAKKISGIMKNTLAKGISGGIQNIINSIGNGENAFANFGNFVLQTMGDMAIQMGNQMILSGIAVEALKSLGGASAIAAGAGLVALGSIMKSISGGGGSTAAPSGGSFDPISTTESSLSEDIADPAAIEKKGPSIAMTVEGNIFNNDETKASILDFLNEQLTESGGTINNASFA